jgi:hypothetical protein
MLLGQRGMGASPMPMPYAHGGLGPMPARASHVTLERLYFQVRKVVFGLLGKIQIPIGQYAWSARLMQIKNLTFIL